MQNWGETNLWRQRTPHQSYPQILEQCSADTNEGRCAFVKNLRGKKKESDIAISQEAIVLDQSEVKQSVLQCKFFCALCSYVKYSITELKPTTLPGGVKGLLSLCLSLDLSLSHHSDLRSLQVSQQESQRVVFFF